MFPDGNSNLFPNGNNVGELSINHLEIASSQNFNDCRNKTIIVMA
jgi:hypothetical protein